MNRRRGRYPRGFKSALRPRKAKSSRSTIRNVRLSGPRDGRQRSVLEDRDLACAELCSIALPELVSMNPLVGAERHAAPGRRTLT
jgi:hypothetical protein